MACISNFSNKIALIDYKDVPKDDQWIISTTTDCLNNIAKKALHPLLKSENCGKQTIGHILKITTIAIGAIFMLAEALVRASLFVITSPLLLTDHSHIPKLFALTALLHLIMIPVLASYEL